jgi:hypothetical protein
MSPSLGRRKRRREGVSGAKEIVVAEQVAGIGGDWDLEGHLVAGVVCRNCAQCRVDDTVPEGGDVEGYVGSFREVGHAELRWRGRRRPDHAGSEEVEGESACTERNRYRAMASHEIVFRVGYLIIFMQT